MITTKRPLGRTGVEVTTIGYGAMELRGAPRGPEIADDDAGRLLNAVLDAGINLIDTSVDYGRSEELIGKYVSHRRDEYFLASKCGCPVGDPPAGATPPYPHDYSASNVRACVEHSLQTLHTDHLDLVQLHTSPSKAELDENETIEALTALQNEGKVRFLGISGGLPNLPDHIAMGVFDVFQIPHSAIRLENDKLIADAAGVGAGVIARSGAGRGGVSLAGPHPRAGASPDDAERRWESSGVEELLGEMSRLEFVLRFTLSQSEVASTLIGTSNMAHLLSNVAIAEKGPLPADLYETRSAVFFPAARNFQQKIARHKTIEV